MEIYEKLFDIIQELSNVINWFTTPFNFNIDVFQANWVNSIIEKVVEFMFGIFGLTNITPLSILTSSVIYSIILLKLIKVVKFW